MDMKMLEKILEDTQNQAVEDQNKKVIHFIFLIIIP